MRNLTVEEASGRTTGGSAILFAVLLALLTTSIAYRFGSGNQLEQIPIVLRQLDPGYLANDFFVSTTVEFGPRFYFAHLVAWISQVVPLHWAYATLTFLSDLVLVAVTLWAARRIVGASRLGCAIAAVLTIAVSSFHLGDATDLRYEVFQPASLAVPGMLLAVGLGWLGRPIPAGIVASLASLPHPLYGIQGGAIAMGTAFLVLLIPHGDIRSEGPRLAWRRAIAQTTVGTAVLAASALVFWWWPYQGTRLLAPLSTEELFSIIARFRSPHHYLPSQFRPQDWVTTAVFCFASWLAFEQWSRSVASRTARVFLVPALFVGAGCIAGTLFTEVWPLRAVLTLQPFRLLSIVKWTGYLLIGWLFGQYWKQASNVLARPVVGLSLMSAAGTFPLVTAAGLSLIRLQAWLPSRVNTRLWVVALAVGAVGLWLNFGSVDERARLAAAITLLVILSQSRRTVRIAGAFATLVFVVGLAYKRPESSVAPSPLLPVFSTDDLRDADARMARSAAVHTPSDAVLIVPPNFGVLRFVGQRALVVDFKSFPFQERHMREWRERIRQVYGAVEGGGVVANRRLEDTYRAITDARLRGLAIRYGATYAVLFTETATVLPEIEANETYRLVRLQFQE